MRKELSSLKPLPYYICFASDEKYLPYTRVALYSLIQKSELDLSGGVILFTDSIASSACTDFINFFDRFRVDICVIGEKTWNRYHTYPVSGHISRVAYARLCIPELCRGIAKQVLYLDSDIMVRRELRTLLESAKNAPLYAVPDRGVRDVSYLQTGSSRYFNSGVLVFNIEKIDHTPIQVSPSQSLRFHDQDVLNVFFAKTWQEVSPAYNAMTPEFQRADSQFGQDTDPAIVHFNTYLKPWQYGARHPYKEEYEAVWSEVYKRKFHPEWSGIFSYCKTLYHAWIPYPWREKVSSYRYKYKR